MSWLILKLITLTAFAEVIHGSIVRFEDEKISKCPPKDYICSVITLCPAAWTLFNAGIQPKICGWKNKTPLVCCPRYVQEEPSHDDEDLFPEEDEETSPGNDKTQGEEKEAPVEEPSAIEDPSAEEPSVIEDPSVKEPSAIEDPSAEEPSEIEDPSAEDEIPVIDQRTPAIGQLHAAVQRKPLKFSLTSAGNCGFREVDRTLDVPESAIRNIYSANSGLLSKTVVVGGTPANQKWSWMAGIYRKNGRTPFCGGSVIDDKHILTAAHCFNPKRLNASRYFVKVGEIDLMALNPSYEIEEIKTHEDYNPRFYNDDIAIIRLKESLPDDVVPVCVPEEDNLYHGDNVTVLGWGQLDFGGRSSRILQEAHGIPIVRNEDCNSKYEKLLGNQFPDGITEKMVCAGREEGGVDSCTGDSGGPLLREFTKDRWALVGIVSFGFSCAEPGFPGVYTRVAAYLPWIREYINEHSLRDRPRPIFVPYNPPAFSSMKR